MYINETYPAYTWIFTCIHGEWVSEWGNEQERKEHLLSWVWIHPCPSKGSRWRGILHNFIPKAPSSFRQLLRHWFRAMLGRIWIYLLYQVSLDYCASDSHLFVRRGRRNQESRGALANVVERHESCNLNAKVCRKFAWILISSGSLWVGWWLSENMKGQASSNSENVTLMYKNQPSLFS